MVIAYHAVFSVYGFWLPNEQRGSWSNEVWAPQLRRFGPATKTTERRSLAHRAHDPQRRAGMRDALQYPPVRCNLDQIHALADGFADAVHRFNIHLYACDILQDHVHLVPARHRENVEFICRVMKSAATRRLTALGLHPLQNHADATGRAPTPWAEGGWERYLVTPPEIVDAVAYANGNPAKHDLPPQQWDFVRPISWHH